jgi:hypothetical protein
LSKIRKRIKEIRVPRIPLAKPPTILLIFLMVSISIFILGGGIYDIMLTPINILPTPTQPIFYYPGMTEQTMTESINFVFYLIIGVLGGYITFQSTRFVYRPREARMYLVIGIVMMIFAFIGCETLLAAKGV